MSFEMIEQEIDGANIKVVGIGGAGGNAINHMIEGGVQGVEFIAIKTVSSLIFNLLSSHVCFECPHLFISWHQHADLFSFVSNTTSSSAVFAVSFPFCLSLFFFLHSAILCPGFPQ